MKPKIQNTRLNILLADDDTDDRFFFAKAMDELDFDTHLSTVHDGEQLMEYLLKNTENLPDVLFLDLSMPRKTGFECLTEIKEDEKLKDMHVVMFSTSYSRDILYEQSMINMLYNIGAQDFIRKPSEFSQLKQVIERALLKVIENQTEKNLPKIQSSHD